MVIDEFHQVVSGSRRDAEWLLHYLQDGVLVGPRGPEEQPRVTIIACSTDVGRVQQPILDRFGLRPQLVDYTDGEAARIAEKLAERILCEPLPLPRRPDCEAIAAAASKNARVMRQILINVRDIALTTSAANWDVKRKRYDLSEALEWLGLSADGLTLTARRLLRVLVEDFAGEPAGVAALRERLQEPGGIDYHERLLLDKGLIARTKAGRALLPDGIRRAREQDVTVT